MLIREFANDKSDSNADAVKLASIATLLADRAEDENAQKQISVDAYINAAKSLGVNLTPETLGTAIGMEPLSNILEPLEPNSGVVRFKGNTEAETGMSVDQARAVVDSNAKAAMKRRQ
jgi:hypothetical protein